MTDPMRWRDQEADAFEASLLASAEADTGSHGARVRSLAALASTARQLANGGTRSRPSGLVVLGSFGHRPLKWLGVGAIAGLGSLAAAQGLSPRGEPSPVLSRLVPQLVARASPSNPWVPGATSTLRANPLSAIPPGEACAEAALLGKRSEALSERSDAPSSPLSKRTEGSSTPLSKRSKGSSTPTRGHFESPLTVQRSGTVSGKGKTKAKAKAARPLGRSEPGALQEKLSREVALLDQARSLLARGKPRAALAALERREREIKSGVLGPEAKLLKVEVLLRVGHRRSAEALANGELARHPRGPHADRLNTLLGEQKP